MSGQWGYLWLRRRVRISQRCGPTLRFALVSRRQCCAGAIGGVADTGGWQHLPLFSPLANQTVLKATPLLILSTWLLAAYSAHGQGTLVYDQKVPGVMGAQTIQGNEPIGQSFTPSLSAVGFIQLELFDANPGNGLGATVAVNLMSGSITGTILGTSTVTLPDGFAGDAGANPPPFGPIFYFATPVAVTPGTTYYFDIDVLSGDTWLVGTGPGGYAGGMGFSQGVGDSGFNLAFEEGIVGVPEPSVTWLALVGGGIFLCFRRWQIKPC